MFPDGPGRMKCPRCGTRMDSAPGTFTLVEPIKGKDTIFLESGEGTVNVTTIECPNCGHDKAEYRQKVIWADEEEMVIYTCLKCRHAWRFGYSSGVSG